MESEWSPSQIKHLRTYFKQYREKFGKQKPHMIPHFLTPSQFSTMVSTQEEIAQINTPSGIRFLSRTLRNLERIAPHFDLWIEYGKKAAQITSHGFRREYIDKIPTLLPTFVSLDLTDSIDEWVKVWEQEHNSRSGSYFLQQTRKHVHNRDPEHAHAWMYIALKAPRNVRSEALICAPGYLQKLAYDPAATPELFIEDITTKHAIRGLSLPTREWYEGVDRLTHDSQEIDAMKQILIRSGNEKSLLQFFELGAHFDECGIQTPMQAALHTYDLLAAMPDSSNIKNSHHKLMMEVDPNSAGRVRRLEDITASLIPDMLWSKVPQAEIDAAMDDAIATNYLLAYDRINYAQLQGTFDESLARVRHSHDLDTLIEQSVDIYFPEDYPDEFKEQTYRIAKKSSKDALRILYEVFQDEAIGKEELDFIEKIVEISGPARQNNVDFYSTEKLEGNYPLDKLREGMLQYISPRNGEGIQEIQPTLFSLFMKGETEEERFQFLESYREARKRVLIEPDFGQGNLDKQQYHLLLSESVRLARFSFGGGSVQHVGKILKTRSQSDVAPVPEGYSREVLYISRVSADTNNQALHALRDMYRAIATTLENGVVMSEKQFHTQMRQDFQEHIAKQSTRIKKGIRKAKGKAKEFLKSKQKSLSAVEGIVATLSHTSSTLIDVLLASSYIANSDADKELRTIAAGIRQQVQVFYAVHSNIASFGNMDGINPVKARYTIEEVSWLSAFYGHLHEGLAQVDLSKNRVLQMCLHTGLQFRGHKVKGTRPNLEQVLSYYEGAFSDSHHPDVARYTLNTLTDELDYLSKRQKSLKETKPITAIPGRGVVDEFAGAMGNACYLAAEANYLTKYPQITNIRLLNGIHLEPGKKPPKLNGNVLFIRAESFAGGGEHIPTLLLRADNPRLGGLNIDDYIEQIERYAKDQFRSQLKREGYKGEFYIVRPNDSLSNRAMTNNAGLHRGVRKRYADGKKVTLVKDIRFNGYTLKQRCVVVRKGKI